MHDGRPCADASCHVAHDTVQHCTLKAGPEILVASCREPPDASGKSQLRLPTSGSSVFWTGGSRPGPQNRAKRGALTAVNKLIPWLRVVTSSWQDGSIGGWINVQPFA